MPIPNFETVALGSPITRLGISFIPVYLMDNTLPEIATGVDSGLVVNELENPDVGALVATNPTNRPTFVMQGEQLVGGDQNRTLNVSVLVPPHDKREIPVSCLEHGRWGDRRNFASGSALAPNSVRMTMLRSVGESARREPNSRGSDQGEVWDDVRRELRSREVTSQSESMADADSALVRDSARHNAVNELTRLGPLPGQCGMVVAYGSRAVFADIMGSPGLFAPHWKQLIRAHLSEQVSTHIQGHWDAAAGPALRILRRMGRETGHSQDAVGIGTEHYVKGRGYVGQALTLWNSTVHTVACFTGP